MYKIMEYHSIIKTWSVCPRSFTSYEKAEQHAAFLQSEFVKIIHVVDSFI